MISLDPMAGVLAFFCVASLGLVVIAALLAARQRRRRAGRIVAWAVHAGWQVVERPAVDWGRRLPGGNPEGVRMLLSGHVGGRPVLVGEYEVTDVQVTTGADGTATTTPHTRHWVVSVAILNHPWAPATVTTRGRLSRRTNTTGDPGFDKAFRIEGVVGPWCTPALIAAHLARHVPVPWSVSGPELMTWTEGRLHPAHPVGDLGPLLHLAALLNGRPA
ncbi:hypothetical protein M1L60_26805 [Actinoplanes sp. TRM 88003]|uniref:DUF4131 domain-containing protein n=1 Tax=Paractinoplanes aksuensis TaxID=2939490 RepID=A0ABT1DTN2_9ACTN|nr:hypothetical protein [Actinoplanes aksuensis]MCO8274216.1 hypothetical protein [Actinoplanes aksuensis]